MKNALLQTPEVLTITTDTHIIKERQHEVDGKVFIVSSFFNRFATKTAEDKLVALIELETKNIQIML